jgi:hypothetical protein
MLTQLIVTEGASSTRPHSNFDSYITRFDFTSYHQQAARSNRRHF